jgi:hypothetical protein
MKYFFSLIFAIYSINFTAVASGPGASSGTNAQPASEPDSTDIMGGGTPGGEQHHGNPDTRNNRIERQETKQDLRKSTSENKPTRKRTKKDKKN